MHLRAHARIRRMRCCGACAQSQHARSRRMRKTGACRHVCNIALRFDLRMHETARMQNIAASIYAGICCMRDFAACAKFLHARISRMRENAVCAK